MKHVFAIIVGLHGLIHIMGFVSAFFSTSMDKQVMGISKPIGSLWLVAFILFLVAATQFLGNSNWFYLAFIAVFLSQVLIVYAWKDAKFGTIPNLLIAIVATSALGTHRFKTMVKQETEAIVLENNYSNTNIVTRADLKHLPEIVQLWLTNSGILDKEGVETVKLKQTGIMRTKPNGNWMPFNATQYFNTKNPSFVWSTTVEAMPVISMIGRDKLIKGKGEMLIKLAGLFPVVDISDNKKINSGSMIRYLSEICWFPSAALKEYIAWEAIGSNAAKAIFTYNSQSVSGIFTFNEDGELISFKAQRYYGGGEKAKVESWLVETKSLKKFNGIKIPNKSTVTWQLETGNFHWLTVEITDLEFNLKE